MLSEEQIVGILQQYYRPPNFWAVLELRIRNFLAISKITSHRRKQQQVQIDLAILSLINQDLVFIEAETDLALDHPLLYRPFAHYVYLATSELAIKNQPLFIQNQQFNLAQQKKIGILGVKPNGQVIVHVSAKKCKVEPHIYRTVLNVFRKKWENQIRAEKIGSFHH